MSLPAPSTVDAPNAPAPATAVRDSWPPEGFREWVRLFAEFHGMGEEEMLTCLMVDPGQGTIHSHRPQPPSPAQLAFWNERVEKIRDDWIAALCEVARRSTGYAQSSDQMRSRMRRLMQEAADDFGGQSAPAATMDLQALRECCDLVASWAAEHDLSMVRWHLKASGPRDGTPTEYAAWVNADVTTYMPTLREKYRGREILRTSETFVTALVGNLVRDRAIQWYADGLWGRQWKSFESLPDQVRASFDAKMLALIATGEAKATSPVSELDDLEYWTQLGIEESKKKPKW